MKDEVIQIKIPEDFWNADWPYRLSCVLQELIKEEKRRGLYEDGRRRII